MATQRTELAAVHMRKLTDETNETANKIAIAKKREANLPQAKEIVAEMIARAESAARKGTNTIYYRVRGCKMVYDLACELLEVEGFHVDFRNITDPGSTYYRSTSTLYLVMYW